MPHPMNDLLNRRLGLKTTPCSKECKYFKFPHLDRACVLSDVFSVLQGEPCFEFTPISAVWEGGGDGGRQEICVI